MNHGSFFYRILRVGTTDQMGLGEEHLPHMSYIVSDKPHTPIRGASIFN